MCNNLPLSRSSVQQEVGGTRQNLGMFWTFLELAAAAPCACYFLG